MTNPYAGGGNPQTPESSYSPPEAATPSPVLTAVRLMYVQAALRVLAMLMLLGSRDQIRAMVRQREPASTPEQLEAAVSAGLVFGLILGSIATVLYVLLAGQVRKGKNWARIVTWVLAGLGVILGLVGLTQPNTTFNLALGVVALILNIAIIVLLLRPAANAYFGSRN